ncbi:transporter substrate-binding domain-containing protein [Rhizobium sp. Pop5]|uniref:transporter substrate-binding domain-containing protein n=1 Tax=Rhizobium sp. Pop5 TaxID=1223565 RepID=UPI000283A1A9|nr:transporter substrate-binding domain-containing protein [Rhizobium sp. Pop5]EJZ17985.1 amino acid ABC transporter substrate-binding protein [Rhizobium sp. Pop5]UVD55153.1 transporter substrate-binding domain-containing protein [Rhizobium sp. Pop5]
MPQRDELLAEIAPTGVIRAAVNMSNAALVQLDPVTGTLTGSSAQIAVELAAELDCGLSLVQYGSAADILAAAEGNEWDVAFIASDPSRADRFSFSPPYTTVSASFLVPDSSPLGSLEHVDVEGVRIAAARTAAYTKQLERLVRNAIVLHTENPASALDMLVSSECDAAAGLTESLSRFCEKNPGFHVVDRAFSKVPQAIAVHRRCVHASTFLSDFIQQHYGAGKPNN